MGHTVAMDDVPAREPVFTRDDLQRMLRVRLEQSWRHGEDVVWTQGALALRDLQHMRTPELKSTEFTYAGVVKSTTSRRACT